MVGNRNLLLTTVGSIHEKQQKIYKTQYSKLIVEQSKEGSLNPSEPWVGLRISKGGGRTNRRAHQVDAKNIHKGGGKLGDSSMMEAEAGCLDGDKHFFGQGVPQSYSMAVERYAAASRAGYAPAMSRLAACFQYGRGLARSEENSLYWYKKAARRKEPDALNALGCICEAGSFQALKQDFKKAGDYYQRAADLGHLDAMTNLGYMFEKGLEVQLDYKAAAYWYLQAANRGYAKAQNNLGSLYHAGKGVEYDPQRAVEWYTKAANQGNAAALNNLGICYEDGVGVDKSLSEAERLYGLSMEKGNLSGVSNLAYVHAQRQDFHAAKHLYTLAARQGSDDALFQLAELMERGLGTRPLKEDASSSSPAAGPASPEPRPDIPGALKLYRRAAACGHKQAAAAVNRLTQQSDPHQPPSFSPSRPSAATISASSPSSALAATSTSALGPPPSIRTRKPATQNAASSQAASPAGPWGIDPRGRSRAENAGGAAEGSDRSAAAASSSASVLKHPAKGGKSGSPHLSPKAEEHVSRRSSLDDLRESLDALTSLVTASPNHQGDQDEFMVARNKQTREQRLKEIIQTEQDNDQRVMGAKEAGPSQEANGADQTSDERAKTDKDKNIDRSSSYDSKMLEESMSRPVKMDPDYDDPPRQADSSSAKAHAAPRFSVEPPSSSHPEPEPSSSPRITRRRSSSTGGGHEDSHTTTTTTTTHTLEETSRSLELWLPEAKERQQVPSGESVPDKVGPPSPSFQSRTLGASRLSQQGSWAGLIDEIVEEEQPPARQEAEETGPSEPPVVEQSQSSIPLYKQKSDAGAVKKWRRGGSPGSNSPPAVVEEEEERPSSPPPPAAPPPPDKSAEAAREEEEDNEKVGRNRSQTSIPPSQLWLTRTRIGSVSDSPVFPSSPAASSSHAARGGGDSGPSAFGTVPLSKLQALEDMLASVQEQAHKQVEEANRVRDGALAEVYVLRAQLSQVLQAQQHLLSQGGGGAGPSNSSSPTRQPKGWRALTQHMAGNQLPQDPGPPPNDDATSAAPKTYDPWTAAKSGKVNRLNSAASQKVLGPGQSPARTQSGARTGTAASNWAKTTQAFQPDRRKGTGAVLQSLIKAVKAKDEIGEMEKAHKDLKQQTALAVTASQFQVKQVQEEAETHRNVAMALSDLVKRLWAQMLIFEDQLRACDQEPQYAEDIAITHIKGIPLVDVSQARGLLSKAPGLFKCDEQAETSGLNDTPDSDEKNSKGKSSTQRESRAGTSGVNKWRSSAQKVKLKRPLSSDLTCEGSRLDKKTEKTKPEKNLPVARLDPKTVIQRSAESKERTTALVTEKFFASMHKQKNR